MRVLKYSKATVFIALCLLHSLTLAATFGKQANTGLDIRILVDVSDNMKTSDTQGFRESSLTLFTKLLPKASNAGVWMFDDMVTELMPVSKVGITWRSQALNAIKKIHSTGKVSNLEKALAVSTLDWVDPDSKVKRHILLLTDGKVTVGENKAANAASKERISNFQISRLNALGVNVHIIALSDGADKELLEKISSETLGWYDQAKTPEHLERTLLRVSKRLVRKNSIPIVANTFTIDDGIKEFTAVVFRKKGFGSTQLDDPEGMDFGKNSKRTGVDWHREKRYDVVTVKNPMEGEWRLVAVADPNNEILVVTELQMAVDKLPESITTGDDTIIKMLMAEKGKLVRNSNFLNVIKATVELKDKAGNESVVDMEQDMINGGYFFADIGKDLKAGPYEMVVRAKGNTFERFETRTIHVKAKPKVVKVEIKPEFRKVLAESGIEVPEEIKPEEALSCPDVPAVAAIAEKEPEEEIVEESDWMITSAIVLLVNILLGVAGFFGYKMYKKKSALADEALVNKLS